MDGRVLGQALRTRWAASAAAGVVAVLVAVVWGSRGGVSGGVRLGGLVLTFLFGCITTLCVLASLLFVLFWQADASGAAAGRLAAGLGARAVSARAKFEAAPKPPVLSSDALRPLEGSSEESCVWLEHAVLPLVNERLSRFLEDNLTQLLDEVAVEASKHRLSYGGLGPLTFSDVVVEGVRVGVTGASALSLLEQPSLRVAEIAVHLHGTAGIAVSSSVCLDWPVKQTACLPFSVRAAFSGLRGKIVLCSQPAEPWVFIGFRSPPEFSLELGTAIGARIRLKDSQTLHRFIVSAVSGALERTAVLPAMLHVNLDEAVHSVRQPRTP